MIDSQKVILVVDDEPGVRKILRRCFEREQFVVQEAADSADTLHQLKTHNIDLITLDLNLRNEDGLELARQIRQLSQVPIIMVSGKGDLIDTVVGLEVGADDYISKPFELREVVARVRAVLRRYQTDDDSTAPAVSPPDTDSVYQFGDWHLNWTTRELLDNNGEAIELTTGEFDLLSVFVKNARQVLSRDQIMDLLKGNEWAPNDRTIDNQVARLRKKLQTPEAQTPLIKTIRGTGYLFTVAAKKPE